MVVFDDNQFEIAIATYKRPEYIECWLQKCYTPTMARNIALSIYDSSPDEDTRNVVERFNQGKGKKVGYHHVDSNTIIGYKPMVPILETKAEYLWVAGDSRCHNFEELDVKFFPYIKERSIDYIVINVGNNYQLPDTMYEDKGKMLHDTFIASTCIGLSIYRVSIFEELKTDLQLMNKCDSLFKNNYGFGWLGYFYHAYAIGNYKTLLTNVETSSVLDKKKTQSWAVRFYGCWADDLCQIIDNIPDVYVGKNDIPRNTWKVMKLDSCYFGHLARKYGDLNAEKYKQMVRNGIIERITDKPYKIRFYANAPMIIIEIDYALNIAVRKYIHTLRAFIKSVKGRTSK